MRLFTSIVVKAGCPSEGELMTLSRKLADDWKMLARRLGFERAEITAFHKENEKLADKANEMLMEWKKRKHTVATYQALYDALCHELVACKALAEQFCCS